MKPTILFLAKIQNNGLFLENKSVYFKDIILFNTMKEKKRIENAQIICTFALE